MRGILLIPVKSLTTAKQRLAAALDQPHRSQLAEAMLRDVMTAAAGVRWPHRRRAGHRRCARASAGRRVRLPGHRRHAQRKRDRRHRDGDGVVRAARLRHDDRRARRHSAHHQRRTAARAGCRSRRKARCSFPPTIGAAATAFCAGRHRSFRCASATTAFCRTAKPCRKTGKELIILEMPGIGLDIDNPHELDCWCSAKATPTRSGCCGRGASARNRLKRDGKQRV